MRGQAERAGALLSVGSAMPRGARGVLTRRSNCLLKMARCKAVGDEGCSLAMWVAIGPGASTFTGDCGGRCQARSGETGRRTPVCRFCQAVLGEHDVIKSETICGCRGHASSGASSVRMPRPAYGFHFFLPQMGKMLCQSSAREEGGGGSWGWWTTKL